MDPRPAGLNRRTPPPDDGRCPNADAMPDVIYVEVVAMPIDFDDPRIVAEVDRFVAEMRRRRRQDLAAAVWHLAIAGMALIVLAVLLAGK